MKIIYIGFFLNLLTTATYTQGLNFEWAKTIGGSSTDSGNAISTDSSGNIYVTGSFSGTADFDPDIGIYNLTSNGLFDIFIIKLDANGSLVWAHSMGDSFFDSGVSIVTDELGNVFVTGSFGGTIDFDPGIDTFNLTSKGSFDIFVLKLDTDGNFIWAHSIGGTGEDRGIKIINATGNIIITGWYQFTLDFDPGTDTFNLTSNGGFDIFALKLDTNGNFIWANSIGGPFVDRGRSIAVDQLNNIYLTGEYQSSVDFDPGAANYNLTSKGGADFFIAKFDSDGNFTWANSVGGTGLIDIASSITTNAWGDVYVTGQFADTLYFNTDIDNPILTSNGSLDVFVLKLNSNGELIWANSAGGEKTDQGYSIASDVYGNVYIAGIFFDTAYFDAGFPINNLISNGLYDAFILKLDINGNFVWANSFGGEETDFINFISSDNLGNVYYTGSYGGTVDFGLNQDMFDLTAIGERDIVVVKLSSTTNATETTLLNEVSVFPNPTLGEVNIDFNSLTGSSIKVFDAHFNLIYQKDNINNSKYNFDLNSISGIYFIEISASGKQQLIKLIKL